MKKYFGLWSILAIAFIVFFLYSFVGSKSLFGFELKSSKLSQSVIVQVDSLSVLNADTDSIMENINIKSVFPQPVDTSSQTILFIGDSMLDGLSPRLAAYAKRSGHSLYSVIWYSSNTEQWGKSHRLTEYICKLHPSYIFICLGANELFVKDIKEKRTGYVKSILNEIDTIPFVWIGPPNWKEDTGINDMLKENLPQGTFFVSNGMKFDRRKDGAHPTAESACMWMDSVARWMPNNSIHPIRLTLPDVKTARPNRVFVHYPEK